MGFKSFKAMESPLALSHLFLVSIWPFVSEEALCFFQEMSTAWMSELSEETSACRGKKGYSLLWHSSMSLIPSSWGGLGWPATGRPLTWTQLFFVCSSVTLTLPGVAQFIPFFFFFLPWGAVALSLLNSLPHDSLGYSVLCSLTAKILVKVEGLLEGWK